AVVNRDQRPSAVHECVVLHVMMAAYPRAEAGDGAVGQRVLVDRRIGVRGAGHGKEREPGDSRDTTHTLRICPRCTESFSATDILTLFGPKAWEPSAQGNALGSR